MHLIDTVGFMESLAIEHKSGPTTHIKSGNHYTFRSRVQITNNNTGERWVGTNKCMVPGSEWMAMNLFYLPHDTFVTPTYNTQIGLDYIQHVDDYSDEIYRCQLFAIGTSGANGSIKYEVNNAKWIKPDDLVPFQYVPYDKDLSAVERAVYFGRKALPEKKIVAYYFKAFDSDPVFDRVWEDDSPLDAALYDNTGELAAQIIVSNSLTITKTDGRDYFKETTGLNMARFNCIELLMCYPTTLNGFTYFQDVRPCTRVNFPDKYLNDMGDSWSIEYKIYF